MDAFERCVNERKLVRVDADKAAIDKEIGGARYDLERAKTSLAASDHKWASVQAYYAMFHAAKAVVLSKGYREKSHGCLVIALRRLFPHECGMADDLELCMELRHEADYSCSYDKDSAKIAIEKAQAFLERSDALL